MADQNTLPPGWVLGTSCVVHKHIEEFTYLEVHYDPDKHQYGLFKICVDGPTQSWQIGTYDDLGKAMRNGDYL